MPLTPLHNQPALFHDESRTLIVADLHIGIEHEMFTAGARIPAKTGEMASRLMKIIGGCKAESLVILGDLKHNLPVSSTQEMREVPEFLSRLLDKVEDIHVIPGNHDASISKLLPEEVKLHPSRGAVIHDIGMWHGHTWPFENVIRAKTTVFAHSHPVAVFVDGVGARSTERCWLRGKWNKTIALERYEKIGKDFVVVPAFSDLCGGSYVNEEKPRLLGPVMKNGLVDLKKTYIYLLDGTHLGKVTDNRVHINRKKYRHRSK